MVKHKEFQIFFVVFKFLLAFGDSKCLVSIKVCINLINTI